MSKTCWNIPKSWASTVYSSYCFMGSQTLGQSHVRTCDRPRHQGMCKDLPSAFLCAVETTDILWLVGCAKLLIALGPTRERASFESCRILTSNTEPVSQSGKKTLGNSTLWLHPHQPWLFHESEMVKSLVRPAMVPCATVSPEALVLFIKLGRLDSYIGYAAWCGYIPPFQDENGGWDG